MATSVHLLRRLDEDGNRRATAPAGAPVTQHRRRGPPTRWTLIRRAQGTGEDARAALGTLIQRYEGFVVALIRAFRPPWDQSPEDLKQAFFAEICRRGDIHKLD